MKSKVVVAVDKLRLIIVDVSVAVDKLRLVVVDVAVAVVVKLVVSVTKPIYVRFAPISKFED